MGANSRLGAYSIFLLGTYSRWALIQGWALIRIDTVSVNLKITKKICTGSW